VVEDHGHGTGCRGATGGFERAGLKSAISIFSSDEAFAVQALAVARELNWTPAKVNIYGGANRGSVIRSARAARVFSDLVQRYRAKKLRYGLRRCASARDGHGDDRRDPVISRRRSRPGRRPRARRRSARMLRLLVARRRRSTAAVGRRICPPIPAGVSDRSKDHIPGQA